IAVHEEPEATAALEDVLRSEGIDVRAGVEIERGDHDGEFHVRVADEVIDTDQLLLAAGRHNNLDDVGLETVGLDPEADTIETDGHLRAGDRLWAVGGITGHAPFTPR